MADNRLDKRKHRQNGNVAAGFLKIRHNVELRPRDKRLGRRLGRRGRWRDLGLGREAWAEAGAAAARSIEKERGAGPRAAGAKSIEREELG